ncbi:MAG: NADPH-flavin oxidoreductase [Promethearchaeota archaeon]|nr:MAG: NADPH-flavin oxidoreductase [Candidatus Lokiarchaeota archaeon]
MDIDEVIQKRRTIRRFKQEDVPKEKLMKLIEYARLAPAGNNVQSVEYIIIKDEGYREKLFSLVNWAGSLPKEERVPEKSRRPMAYIIVLVNTTIKKEAPHDVGAAVENILLGAVNLGLGACWMGSIHRKKIRELFGIDDKYKISHVISLGYPDEKSSIEPYERSFKYWKDEDGNMHVPKRSVDDIIVKSF